MARTIEEIKSSMTADFMANEHVAKIYGFTPGDEFESVFSKVSVESVWFYIVSCAMWVLEKLMDAHKAEVDSRLEAMIPHRAKWYRDKALLFMPDRELADDSDEYDTSGMTEAEIAACRPVKYAAVEENESSSILTIKVAGEIDGERVAIDDATLAKLKSYYDQIKDAGVGIELVSREGDSFGCKIDIYYNAMYSRDSVASACKTAIVEHVKGLPFNGVYTNMALVDTLQTIEGVKVVELKQADMNGRIIDGLCRPGSGYFAATLDSITLEMIPY